jgi:hypothetical protein
VPRPRSLAIFCYSLRTFLDLDYLVRDQTMRLAMDSLRRFLVRSFSKAEDLAALLVVPVPNPSCPLQALNREGQQEPDDFQLEASRRDRVDLLG